MLIIAGVLNFKEKHLISKSKKQVLSSLLSRNKNCELFNFGEGNFFSTAAYFKKEEESQFCHTDEESITYVLGDPYLENLKNCGSRRLKRQLFCMHNLCKKNDWDILKNNARGVFAVIHYNMVSKKLFLVSDKLGILPLYYFFDEDKIVFSSALRVLEGYPFISRKLDIRGISEIAVFGYSLAKRTAYRNIKRISESEIIEFNMGSRDSTQYWNWAKIQEVKSSNTALQVKKAYDFFCDSISIRLEKDSSVISFLSGGLDSRCIATILKEYNCNVHAFNFSQNKSQDQFFASLVADKLKLNYIESNFKEGANWSQMIADAWKEKSVDCKQSDPERPWAVWSGDGGSVGVGFVYLNHEIIQKAIDQKLNEAIALYIKDNGFYFPYKILKKSAQTRINNFIFIGIKEEVERLNCTNYARALHLFLMLNDQRRHLDQHFENFDLHNTKFHLPFYDSFFLECIFALPVSYCLNHKFYMDWFDLFSKEARTVPWQTYPGHIPCPVPFNQKLHYQWDMPPTDINKRNFLKRKKMASSFIKKYFKKLYPIDILNGGSLTLAALLQYFNIRNYEHIFFIANLYMQYWGKSTLSTQKNKKY